VSTSAPRMSSSAPFGELLARGVDAIRQETSQARGLWQEFGWGGFDEPGPQTESAIERGFRQRGPVDDQWGRSECIDPDNVGEIADEGLGHRG
jgi:hypothetical protein